VSSPVADLVERLNAKRSGSGWMANCPAHDDREPSLSISEGNDGRVLLTCLAGRDTNNVLRALGMTLRDLFPAIRRRQNSSEPVAAYDYTDETGQLLYQVCRFEPKIFRQRQPDGNDGWIHNTKNVRRVLYNLPAVIKSQTVGIVEGEKDANALIEIDIVATTNCGGAGKWRDEYSETLRGKDVVIFGDDDEPGQKHLKQVVESLTGKARSIKIVTLRGFHDISDFIAARPAATAKQAVDKLIEETLQINNLVNSLGTEAIPSRLNSNLPKIQLPGDGRLLSAFAADCAKVLKNCGIYERGGVAFIVNQQGNGLDVITAVMLRTLAEQHLICFRVRGSGDNVVTLPRTMSTEDAQGVLSAQQFLSRLPKVARIASARLPVMRENGVIELLASGYDRASLTLTVP